MSDENMRAEFEAAYSAGVIYAMEHTSSIQFEDIYKQRAWAAWQASRAALVVELPPKISEFNTDENGFVNPAAAEHDEAIDDCRAVIEAAGVRVKP